MSVKEVHTPISLEIEGQLPSYLVGDMYRVGPGIFDLIHSDGLPAEIPHWFDGIGVVFKFEIDPLTNSVSFMCRSICPEAVRAIESTPKAEYKNLSFGKKRESLPQGLIESVKKLLRPFSTDPTSGEIPMNINVTLEQIPGHGLVARSDFSRNVGLDENLEHSRTFDFESLNPRLRGVAAAAHSAVDEETGELFNFAAGDWRNPGLYRVFRIAKDGSTEILAEIKANPTCHVHSLVVTKHFVVLAISPWKIDVPELMKDCALAPALQFDESKKTDFFIISREKKQVVAKYEAQAFAAFHYVNAFEEEETDTLHVDVCKYDRADILEQFYLRELRSRNADYFTPVHPVRYTMHGARKAEAKYTKKRPRHGIYQGVATDKKVSNCRLELPCIAPSVAGKEYRYSYGVSHDEGHDGILANALVKVDMETGGINASWSAPRHCMGEPIFVADPHGTEEDDGVILTAIVDAAKQGSALVVLDARNLEEIARAHVPQTVPHAFHGLYVARDSEHSQQPQPNQ